MDYNSKRKKLPLPEYGRNIQKMVDHLFTIEDREERNLAAQRVIEVMGNLYPYLRDVPEFKHKLWDHLAIMGEFKLDIDYPFAPPKPETFQEKPHKVPYNQHKIKYSHYGRTMELFIDRINDFKDEEREILIAQLANHMKKSYLNWGNSSVTDEKIFTDLEEIANNHVEVDKELILTDSRVLTNYNNKKSNKKRRR